MTKKQIREYREKFLGASRAELAKKLDLSTSSIYRYESKDTEVPGWYQEKLFLLSPEDIIHEDGFKGAQCHRLPSRVVEIDKTIVQHYDELGCKGIAEMFGESDKYIRERASTLKARGIRK